MKKQQDNNFDDIPAFKNYDRMEFREDGFKVLGGSGSDDPNTVNQMKQDLVFGCEEYIVDGVNTYHEWFSEIVSLLGCFYYVLSLEDLMTIFNSRKGYHLDYTGIRQAVGEHLLFTMAGVLERIDEGGLEDLAEQAGYDGIDSVDDIDDLMDSVVPYVPLRSKKSGKEYIVCTDVERMDDTDEAEEILDDYIKIKDIKPLYIPTPDEAKDVWDNYIPLHSSHVQKAVKAFKDSFKVSNDTALRIVGDTWTSFARNSTPTDALEWIPGDYEEVKVRGLDDMQKLSGIVMELYNHTNMMANNGWSPAELHEKMRREKGRGKIADGMTSIVPMSSMAAEGLRKAGIPNVDYNATGRDVMTFTMQGDQIVSRGSRKVYPNDPCPCGSGKKYKKCCGKR